MISRPRYHELVDDWCRSEGVGRMKASPQVGVPDLVKRVRDGSTFPRPPADVSLIHNDCLCGYTS